MADIKKSLIEVFNVEFGNRPEKFLHKNHGETGYTLGGIYQTANPLMIDWGLVEWLVSKVGIDRASTMLYNDKMSMRDVIDTYKKNYWSPLNLNHINSQKIANEIFLMGVVSGVKNSAKIAQRIVDVTADGIVGSFTIRALNDFNEDEFDEIFDKKEIAYFESLARNNSKYERFVEGWRNRAIAV